ncbi:MAG: hypothetical protein SGPRY_003489 [Prymnesium sp.]
MPRARFERLSVKAEEGEALSRCQQSLPSHPRFLSPEPQSYETAPEDLHTMQRKAQRAPGLHLVGRCCGSCLLLMGASLFAFCIWVLIPAAVHPADEELISKRAKQEAKDKWKCHAMLKDPSHVFRLMWSATPFANRRAGMPTCFERQRDSKRPINAQSYFSDTLQTKFCNSNWYNGNEGDLGRQTPRFSAPAAALLGFDDAIDAYCASQRRYAPQQRRGKETAVLARPTLGLTRSDSHFGQVTSIQTIQRSPSENVAAGDQQML